MISSGERKFMLVLIDLSKKDEVRWNHAVLGRTKKDVERDLIKGLKEKLSWCYE